MSTVAYDPATRPGIANLFQILYHLDAQNSAGGRTIQDFAASMADISKKALKEKVASAIDKQLSPIREKYEEILSKDSGRLLDDVAAEGATKARKSAEATMVLVREAVGL
jgi:tryptophanyl-tRNA synthetase